MLETIWEVSGKVFAFVSPKNEFPSTLIRNKTNNTHSEIVGFHFPRWK